MQKIKNYSYVSLALAGVSVAVAIMSGFGENLQSLTLLFFSDPGHAGLTDIISGQIWRLLTPMFIHFGVMHLLFNMLWLWDLGAVIENRKGPTFLMGFVLAVSAASNLVQYLFSQSPYFGGMSGVVYGLFAYVWIRGRYDASFSSGMRKATVHMMLAWFVLCWTGLLGPIANWAHTMGLLTGAAWAYLECRGQGWSLLPASARSARQQNLQYFSTADILKAEAQRDWVKEQYLPEARSQFDTVEGKLKIIEAILRQKPLETRPQHEVQAIELVFADALVLGAGLKLATVDDDNQRTPVLIPAEPPLVIFQLVPANRLMDAAANADLPGLYQTSLQKIAENLRSRLAVK